MSVCPLTVVKVFREDYLSRGHSTDGCVDAYRKSTKTPNKRPLPINAPPPLPKANVESFFTFLAISQPKMVRFSFRKKLLRGGNVPFKAVKLANAHGRLLGVLRYLFLSLQFIALSFSV